MGRWAIRRWGIPYIGFLVALTLAIGPGTVVGQGVGPSPAPANLTVSKPDVRRIEEPPASPPPSQFREREQVLNSNLLYQKSLSSSGIAGRSRQDTLLFEVKATPRPQAGTHGVSTGQDHYQLNLPSGGFSKESGIKNPPSGGGFGAPHPHTQPNVVIDQQFDGDTGSEVAPPDMQLSVGTKYIVQVDNTNMTVWDKASTQVPKARWNISATVFKLPDNVFAGDPWIVYDSVSHRWFLSAMISDYNQNTEWLAIAASSTDDPRDAWTFRNIHFPDETNLLRDQPKIAVTKDKLLIAWDEYTDAPNFDQLAGGNWMVLGKDVFITAPGDISASPAYAVGDKCLDEPIPVREASDLSDGLILAAIKPSQVQFCPAFGLPPPNFTANQIVGILVSGVPPNLQQTKRTWIVAPYSAPANPPQHGTNQKLFAGDTRIVSAFRNGDRVYAGGNDACKVSVSCFRVIDIKLSDPSTKPAEDFDVSIGNRYLIYPSLGMDNKGDLIAVASQVMYDGFLGAVVFDRLAGHEHSSDWGITTIKTPGKVAMNCPQGGLQWPPDVTRVGDYAGADTDPVAPNAVWVSTGIAPPSLPGSGPPYDPLQCPEASVIARIIVK